MADDLYRLIDNRGREGVDGVAGCMWDRKTGGQCV
jgi:hypothetical protein